MKRLMQIALIVVIAAGVVGVVLAQPAGKDCTSEVQAGRVWVQLDDNGLSLQSVPLPNAYCGPYVVVANPQGSGGAAATVAEFDIDKWFVDSFISRQFMLGVEGEPNAAAWFHWVAVASYE